MGHANVKNLSELVVRQIYAKGKVSIAEMLAFAVKHKEYVHASEGVYEEPEMIGMILEELVGFYLSSHKFTPRDVPTPVIEPCDMTEEQERIYGEWVENGADFENWTADEDDPKSDYNTFDSIKWRFAPGWRSRYPDVPILEYHES